MKKILFLVLLALMPFMAHGQSALNNIYGCANAATYSTGPVPLSTGTGFIQLMPAPSTNYFLPSRAYHICSFDVSITQPGTPVNWGLVSGQGANCGTNTQYLKVYPGFGTFQSIGQVYQSANTLNAAPNSAVCLYTSGPTSGVTVNVTYSTQ